MVRLRRTRYLSCFYCGRRSSIAFNDAIREFTCANCDATNYLDENGDITDPPVSSTAATESTSSFFASGPDPFRNDAISAGQGSPGDGAAVFCKTCLKNQHLFISSLAQYFPSDPDHPDTAELDRRYFRFRQGLEQRYPQVCAECEPRVLGRIREAGYTAKTDHLRRMVDYSRQVRLTRATPIDAANWIGQKLWWAGIVLQILWQSGVIGSFLVQTLPVQALDTDDVGFGSDTIIDGDAAASASHTPAPTFTTTMLAICWQYFLRLVVSKADVLRTLCIAATLASCWWNPFLVQTARGFTKPLIGIPTWYVYQLAILLVRLMLDKVAGSPSTVDESNESAATSLPPTIAGAHAVAALFTLYLYTTAPRVIRKDLRPLFLKLPETPLTPQRTSKDTEPLQRHSESRRHNLESISDVLDEIATEQQQRHIHSDAQRHIHDVIGDGHGWQSPQIGMTRPRTQQTADGISNDYTAAAERTWRAGIGSSNFGTLGSDNGHASTTPASRPPQTWLKQQDDYIPADVDEMDWTPTQPSLQTSMQSPHRAFNTYQTSASQFGQGPSSPSAGAFSSTPVGTDQGPFWYKVPPAPTNIARKLLNRPNVPPFAQKDSLGNGSNGSFKPAPFFRSKGDGSPGRTHLDTRDLAGAPSSVEFAPPSFFAEDMQRTVNKANDGQSAHKDDDPGSLSDLFSHTFSLGAGSGCDEDDGAYSASSGAPQGLRRAGAKPHARRKQTQRTETSTAFGRSFPLLLGQSAIFVAPVATLVAAYFLRQSSHESFTATITTGATTINLYQYVQPHARPVEAFIVTLCTARAIFLTGESIYRLRRSRTLSSLTATVGLFLGLASIALAGWMSLQMWLMLQAERITQTGDAPLEELQYVSYEKQTAASGGTHGWLNGNVGTVQRPAQLVIPWSWWEIASLHGTVLAHQAWNRHVQ
ncbi:hypothetical protein SEPCBS57363_004629 [Sporothrix epigloea]|uniref:Ima1 N-terminal domain-containing protein n=1 Tax=Sporothrix epigloea TaxID=1892477 RepID=A0ABP0DX01_9PEZI